MIITKLEQRDIPGCREIYNYYVKNTSFSLEETELTAETPYDEMYRYYVEAQVHYANGETARYNNAVSLWNNGFLTYRDYCCRRETPEGRAKALRLC